MLWLACHDPFEDNAEAAADLWEYSGASLGESFVQPLIRYLGHANADVRSAAATALQAGLEVCTPPPFSSPQQAVTAPAPPPSPTF